ncbi:MAG: S-layer homology domain-containing protein, partial [Clostridia bacterium]|nr:S-layer homology domain-containing protein [Clostridia bacterium]
YMNLSYNNNVKNFYEYLDARFNAQTGKLISLSHYAGDHTYSYAPDASISKTQKSNAEVQINKFIKKVAADELSNCKEDKTIESYPYVKKMYYRYVNDIKYENNGINIWYNAVDSDIYNYSLNYTDDAVFPNPEGIITREKAYNNMITFSPLKKIYIISDGEYKLCYYHDVSPYQKIDAFTGEPVNFDEKPYPTSFEYNDISGHWAENAINSLGKIGIGFNSKQFEPDAEIKQSDLLRLMASSLFYNDYIKYDDKTLYEVLSYSDIITPQEKNAENYVTREDAFVFMIRMLYLDKVASLSNIFKVEYTDGNLFSEGKLGYAAILSGLNVIKGDGNEIRPKDNITRAETATMVYNYLLNN